ncbi:MAG: hypothetical protein KGQ37_05085 [Hyphomicrobiales bacterium]|nr:hypothetical protein [Hyphomicrobiales bacterium]
MTSLARLVFLWVLGLLTLVGLLSFFISYRLALGEADDFLDRQMRQIALNVGVKAALPVDGDALVPGRNPSREDRFVIIIRDRQGTILRASPPHAAMPPVSGAGFHNLQLGTVMWRVFVATGKDLDIEVAQRQDVRDETARNAGLSAALPLLVLVPLAGLLLALGLRHLSRRMRRLADEAARTSLSGPMPPLAGHVPREIAPLVEALHTHATRQAGILAAQRRFLADAAHQMRSPLAAMQIDLDNLAAAVPDAAALQALRASIRRQARLVAQLLTLARQDAAHVLQAFGPISLSAVLAACIAGQIARAEARGIDLGLDAGPDIGVIGNADECSMLIDNLLDNALFHTPEGGVVDASLHRQGDGFILRLCDGGAGVAPADLPRLGERFYRGQSPKGEGSGLGLAIALAIARRHSFTLAFANATPRGGLCAELAGPCAALAPEALASPPRP